MAKISEQLMKQWLEHLDDIENYVKPYLNHSESHIRCRAKSILRNPSTEKVKSDIETWLGGDILHTKYIKDKQEFEKLNPGVDYDSTLARWTPTK